MSNAYADKPPTAGAEGGFGPVDCRFSGSGCRACVATRLPVATFRETRRFRRIRKRNADLEVRTVRADFDPMIYDLYAAYIDGRHRDGDMYPPSEDQFRCR